MTEPDDTVPIAEVVWLTHSHSAHRWLSHEEVTRLEARCRSATGYICHADSDRVVLAGSQKRLPGGRSVWADVRSIPRGLIVSITPCTGDSHHEWHLPADDDPTGL